MSESNRRSREKGNLDRGGAVPMAAGELTEVKIPKNYNPGLIDFFGPIGTLLGVAIVPYIVTYFFLGQTDSPTLLIAEASILAVLAGFVMSISKGIELKVAREGLIDGCKGVTLGAIILAFAVTLKEVTDAVGTAEYVIEML